LRAATPAIILIMANKALSKRQKLIIRVEPSQRALKPRNPIAVAAKQRVAGSHEKSGSAKRQLQNRILKKILSEPEES
jgi:hypothetical protein